MSDKNGGNEELNKIDFSEYEHEHDDKKAHWLVEKTARFIVKNRKITFFLFIFLVLAGTFFIKNIFIDNSIELWFLENDPALVSYNEFKKIYGNDEVIIAMINSGEQGIFTPGFLNKIRQASIDIENKNSTENNEIRRVLSVGKAPYIGLHGSQDLIVEDIFENTLETQLQADNVKKRFYENKLWPKILADKSLKYAVLIIEPKASKEMDEKRPKIIEFVNEKLRKHGLDYKLAGMGIMYNELNRLSLRDSAVFTMLSYVVLLLVVLILFRSRHLVMVIFVIMLVSSLTFLDVYGFFHQNFNMVTIILPTLIMILCIADVNHIFNHYCLRIPDIMKDREEGLIKVYTDVMVPSLFTSFIECLGFISIVFTPISILKTFGLFAGFSAMAEYVIILMTTPLLFGMIKPDTTIKMARPFVKLNNTFMEWTMKKCGSVNLIFLALLLVCLFGLNKLEVDTYSMGFLLNDNSVRMESDVIESVYGNYLPLEVRLIADKNDGIKEPAFLNKLVKAQTELEKLPDVSKCASFTDVIMRLNQVWTDGKPESYDIPDSSLKVSQLLMLYESDPKNDLEYMVDKKNYKEARLTVRIPMVSASNMEKVQNKVADVLNTIFDNNSNVKVVFSGYVPLYIKLLGYITWSQVTSFGSALIYIFLFIGIIFKRASALVWGIVPNVFPIVATLGVMGFLGLRLDVATVTIASITLGIATDDTIHELFRYYEHLARGKSAKESIFICMFIEGPTVISTSIVFAIGFCVLGFASIKSVIYFGLLISLSMVIAMFAEIFFLPAFIAFMTGFEKPKQIAENQKK